jgi:hypothetical protein
MCCRRTGRLHSSAIAGDGRWCQRCAPWQQLWWWCVTVWWCDIPKLDAREHVIVYARNRWRLAEVRNLEARSVWRTVLRSRHHIDCNRRPSTLYSRWICHTCGGGATMVNAKRCRRCRLSRSIGCCYQIRVGLGTRRTARRGRGGLMRQMGRSHILGRVAPPWV